MNYNYPISKISAGQLIAENILLHEDSLKNGSMIQVEIDPIDFCNHNCDWCFTANFREDKSLNLIKLKSYLDNFITSNGKSVVFSGGGEPLLYKAIYQKMIEFNNKSIIKYLCDHNISVGLITNGSLMKNLLESDFDIIDLGFVRISLDASDSRTHKKRHNLKKEDFNKIIDSIRGLNLIRGSSFTPAIGISFIVNPINNQNFTKEEISHIRNLSVDLGVDFVQLKHIHTHDKNEANKALKIVHKLALKLNWSNTEFWVQEYANGISRPICNITNHIQAVGHSASRFPCCHLFGKDDYLNQDTFEPKGKTIFGCQNKVCRYEPMNILLDRINSNNQNLKASLQVLQNSLTSKGFHPYRFCPTAPKILEPYKSN